MDIQIVWDPANARGDWAIAGGDLAVGNDLQTAVLLSIFTDRVLPSDQAPLDGTNDRRGWWADTYETTPIGSRLWTLKRAKKSAATNLLTVAQDICAEALQWLIDDGVASAVAVRTYWATAVQMGIVITITEPSGASSTFDILWKAA